MNEYTEIDAELGEKLWDNEAELTKKIADAISNGIRPGRRNAIPHPKAHGCVRAEFHVDGDFEKHPDLAQGVFVPGKTYQAYIRFSNGNPDPTKPDAAKDARGMAIKLLGVKDHKILAQVQDAQTQDFIMINHPVFFVDDPARYLSLLQVRGDGPLAELRRAWALGFRSALIARAMTSSKVASPLATRYWSMSAYRLGDPPRKKAIKFSATPRPYDPKGELPKELSPNFLRETLIKQLAAGEAKFDFSVQIGAPGMSVEDSTREWKETDAPFVKVATITIPRQEYSSAKQDEFGENLSFAPWHALPQHRPLGVSNRMRRVAYEASSTRRHKLNKPDTRTEPAGTEADFSNPTPPPPLPQAP